MLFQEGGHNTSGETENDIPKFITDANDKTNYMRGKFLGKVRDRIQDIHPAPIILQF